MKSPILLAILCFCGTSALAQAQTGAGASADSGITASAPPGTASTIQLLLNKQQASADSIQQFTEHNYAAAEAILEAGNLRAPGTPEWDFESGFSLMQIAFQFHSEGDSLTATAIAQLAAGHLAKADAAYGSAADPAEIANEKEIAGYVYEFLLGDRATAKGFYQAAVALSPNSGQAAALLAQITSYEAEETARQVYVAGAK
jgi:tetratricopeptide (TPR) repeat protein